LIELGHQLTQPGALPDRFRCAAAAFQRQVTEPLPENSMDVDPITDSEE
jgi:hypothetical protein